MHPALNSVHESIVPLNAGFIWQSLCTRQYAECHRLNSSQGKSLDLLITWCRVQITPAAAGPNPFAGHFPFPVPALNHYEMSEQVFHTFMINDLLDPKIWPSKAQTSGKSYYLNLTRSSDSVTQIQSKSLGNNFQSHCSCNCIHLYTCYCILDTFWKFHLQL